MKKRFLSLFVGIGLVLPVSLWAQFMGDYYPTGMLATSNTVNLVSVVENFPNNSGESRSVNTIHEDHFNFNTDAWVFAVDAAGVPTVSLRYGNPDVNEAASALIRCPNGDFIVIGNTEADGLPSAWAFRIDVAGNILWSRRYYEESSKIKSYCIKQTNEGFLSENYVIAGTTDSDRTLIAFKINSNGNVIWHAKYFDPNAPADVINVPKSMIAVRRNLIIVGNRTFGFAGTRDVFLIGVNQTTGAEAVNYRYIDNGGRDDFDPFINFARNNEFVLTYQSNVNIFGQSTGRIAWNRLTNTFTLALPTTSIFWEGGAVNSYGHSIYLSNGATATQYDIGGGTTVNGQQNPLFFSVDNNGNYIPGSYRRLWVNEREFTSTFMMQDAFNGANQYEHHNYYLNPFIDPTPGNISLLRDQTLASPCNIFPDFFRVGVDASLVIEDYKEEKVLEEKEYPIGIEKVHGDYKQCNGNSGQFRVATTPKGLNDKAPGFAPAGKGFKVYPSPVGSGSPVKINFEAVKDDDAVISVYNLQMQQVMRKTETVRKGTNELSVNEIGKLAAGTYIVEIRYGGESYKTKIVRQ